MKIDGTYPGSLLSFVDQKMYVSYSSCIVGDHDKLVIERANGWVRGPAIVCASLNNVFVESGTNQVMYVLTAETIGWCDVDRSRKSVEYIVSAMDII